MADDRERLDLLYDLGRRLSAMHDADELVLHAAQRIRDFFRAEGCSVLLLDTRAREFHFSISANRTDSATNPDVLRRTAFPADRGIAGWVLGHDEGIWVPDVTRDTRFYKGVDEATGSVTQSLMCVPLRTVSGSIGVVELMNPVVTPAPEDDLNFLGAIASDVATAYEKADLQRRTRQEAQELRYLGVIVGVVLIVVGGLLAAFAVFGHLARALPLAAVWTHAEVLVGLGLVAGGLALLVAIRRTATRARRG